MSDERYSSQTEPSFDRMFQSRVAHEVYGNNPCAVGETAKRFEKEVPNTQNLAAVLNKAIEKLNSGTEF